MEIWVYTLLGLIRVTLDIVTHIGMTSTLLLTRGVWKNHHQGMYPSYNLLSYSFVSLGTSLPQVEQGALQALSHVVPSPKGFGYQY